MSTTVPHPEVPAAEPGGGRNTFGCSIEHQSRRVVVSLYGELDLAAIPELRRRILGLFALPIDRVTLELGGVTFIDSSGLELLVIAHHAATDQGVALDLERVPLSAMRLLDLTDLTSLFAIRET